MFKDPSCSAARLTAITTRVLALSTLMLPAVAGAQLYWSTDVERSEFQPLQGAVLQGPVYVFIPDENNVNYVHFRLDGVTARYDGQVPFDLRDRDANGIVQPWFSNEAGTGTHTIRAEVLYRDGRRTTYSADFSVASTPPVEFTPAQFTLDLSPDQQQEITILTSLGAEDDGATATASLVSSEPWLLIPDASVVVPGDLTLTVDTTGLEPGQYTATLAAQIDGKTRGELPVTITVNGGEYRCAPLVCSKIRVELPYLLEFNGDSGHLADANGTGTGFTYFDQPTNGTGYNPANLFVDPERGTLRIHTAAGIQYGKNNNLENALGVGIAAPNQITVIDTRVKQPRGVGTSNRFEQAGLWFGMDEDHYVKLVIIDTNGQLQLEYLGESAGADEFRFTKKLPTLADQDIQLRLVINPYNLTVDAQHIIGDGIFQSLGVYSLPEEFFSFDAAGLDPEIGTRSFAGIFATHRLGPSAVDWEFEYFRVTAAERPSEVSDIEFSRVSHTLPFPTSMSWGPDNRLYVSELFGIIHALTFDSELNVIDDEVISTLVKNQGRRMTLGLTIGPESTADDVHIWVAHSSPSTSAGELNSGIVSHIHSDGFSVIENVITGLPRAFANHATNELRFGPDQRLYIPVGGNTGAGSVTEAETEFGDRPEQPLSAAIVVADVFNPSFNGACYAEGQDPLTGDPGCDVQLYATGLRNSYGIVFHSNGLMYATDNGLGVTGAVPPSPAPPCDGLGDPRPFYQGGGNPGTQPDLLLLIEEGAYYGHPNPARGECVFKSGHVQGVDPLSNYRDPLLDLGDHRSVNGIIEYTSDTVCGKLKNNLLYTNYSVGDDVTRVQLSEDGRSVVGIASLITDLIDPLTLMQNPDGDIFVAEFGDNKVTALRPTIESCEEE